MHIKFDVRQVSLAIFDQIVSYVRCPQLQWLSDMQVYTNNTSCNVIPRYAKKIKRIKAKTAPKLELRYFKAKDFLVDVLDAPATAVLVVVSADAADATVEPFPFSANPIQDVSSVWEIFESFGSYQFFSD